MTEKEDQELAFVKNMYRVKENMEQALKIVVNLGLKQNIIDEGERILNEVNSYLKLVRGY